MAKKQSKRKTISDQLRAAIKASKKSNYQLAIESGVDVAAISRFMASQRSLTLDSADKICAVLNLHLL